MSLWCEYRQGNSIDHPVKSYPEVPTTENYSVALKFSFQSQPFSGPRWRNVQEKSWGELL